MLRCTKPSTMAHVRLQALLSRGVSGRRAIGEAGCVVAGIDCQPPADHYQDERGDEKPDLEVGHALSSLRVQRVKRWITTPATNQPAATRR